MTGVRQYGPPSDDDSVWTVRGGTEQEYPEALRVFAEALNIPVQEELRGEREHPVAEHERTLLALDGDRTVGTAMAHSFEMTMPGGPRPVAGVTGVGVWPTHRRRGVLSALMRRQLADIRARGENLAALWASEGGIYGRFGYGVSSREMRASVQRVHARLRPDAPRDPSLAVELVEPAQAREEMERLHRQALPSRVGQFSRSANWWSRMLTDKPGPGAGRTRVALVRGPDGSRGYALHRLLSPGESGLPQGQVMVRELVTTTPAARVALYEHLLERDLIAETVFESLPEDDALSALLADPGRLVRHGFDELWIRLVDVPGALSDRPYNLPVDTVLEVADRFAPWNAGRWRLRADAEGARVEATDAAPDLSLDVSHLGAAYLGRTSPTSFVDAGVATEHTPGVAARLGTALYAPRAPFCGTGF
ncbi:GNAT family N-acetyltransferase [Nocardiopsis quinghaiensis]|uniref:GNAT family N-acetyltransferase n=1 Tax=Nocardiopsis quinghaiensis TaxID=464995 RepID=UPI00123BCF63|nr:GNAT family N-acetyltransferase [Nocardiopsis quinghaiensis]